jgi:hypothetical protein
MSTPASTVTLKEGVDLVGGGERDITLSKRGSIRDIRKK